MQLSDVERARAVAERLLGGLSLLGQDGKVLADLRATMESSLIEHRLSELPTVTLTLIDTEGGIARIARYPRCGERVTVTRGFDRWDGLAASIQIEARVDAMTRLRLEIRGPEEGVDLVALLAV